MIYVGLLSIAISIVGIILHKKTLVVDIIETHQNGKTRIVRKFVVFKLLPDNKNIMRFGFLQTKNIIQIRSFASDEFWIDVSWASAQQ